MTKPDPAATPICPECGKDPRAGSPRAPWWCRRTGLPLWLAAIALLITGLHASGPQAVFSQPGTFWIEGAEGGDDLTIGTLRAAERGDSAALEPLTQGLLKAGLVARPPWAWLVRETPADPLEAVIETTIGRPFPWLILSDRRELNQGPTSPPQHAIRWDARGAAVYGWWTDGNGRSGTASVECGALALVAATAASAFWASLALARRLKRRSPRRCAWVCGLVVLTALLVPWATTSRTSRMTGWCREIDGLRWADVERLAETRAGRITMARRIARDLEGDPAAPICLRWTAGHDSACTEEDWGWPTRWALLTTWTPPAEYQRPGARAPVYIWWRSSHLCWAHQDARGRQRSLSINTPGFAASLSILSAVYLLPRGCGWLIRGRRLKRYEREGRCFQCGYDVRTILHLPESTP